MISRCAVHSNIQQGGCAQNIATPRIPITSFWGLSVTEPLMISVRAVARARARVCVCVCVCMCE